MGSVPEEPQNLASIQENIVRLHLAPPGAMMTFRHEDDCCITTTPGYCDCHWTVSIEYEAPIRRRVGGRWVN
jgi:hypothetical protein